MRRTIAVIGFAVVIAAVAVSGAMGSFSSGAQVKEQQSSASTAKAALRLVTADPLKVAGVGFKKWERVRLSMTGAGSATRHVRAGRRGSFVVGFGHVECGSLTIVAVGRRGSRASLNYSAVVCR